MWGIDGMYIAGADGSGHQIALAGHRLVIAGFHDPLNNSHRPDAFAKRVVHRDWRQAHDVWRAKIRDHSCAAKCFADSRCVGVNQRYMPTAALRLAWRGDGKAEPR